MVINRVLKLHVSVNDTRVKHDDSQEEKLHNTLLLKS